MKELIKFIVTPVCLAALIPVFMCSVGCNKDKTIEDRKANYNQEMEDMMRSSTKRQEIEEELAEERAYQESQEAAE